MNLSEILEEFRRLPEPSILLLRRAAQGLGAGGGRLGIFPASFNPPTKAHLMLIRRAAAAASLDEVLVLLDTAAMDKEIIGARLEDRISMLNALFQKKPHVSIGISNRGLFIDKVGPLKNVYPSAGAFVFIVGFDTIERVMDRTYYADPRSALDQLFGACEFVVAGRMGCTAESLEALLADELNQPYRPRISFLSVPSRYAAYSSSTVRRCIHRDRSVRDWIPASVLRFIQQSGLYVETSS
jgi:nicotinate (nicotinamide) nucleotide adenylyltransferase